MPEIIVSVESDNDETPVLLRETVTERSLESDHYTAQLMERIGWAVVDASEVETETDQLEQIAG